MHRWILGAALALTAFTSPAAPTAAAAVPKCPALGAALVERFLSADCFDCWTAAAEAVPSGGWLFDWITPAGDAAAMSAAALVEAQERALRAAAVPPAGSQRASRRAKVAPPPGVRLSVESGPAWQGYIGVNVVVAGKLPAGASAWVALVEMLPAGSDGSVLERRLLRTVSGPLPLDLSPPARKSSHRMALRWPEGAKPERLQARAWIEGGDGRILAVVADRCAMPPA